MAVANSMHSSHGLAGATMLLCLTLGGACGPTVTSLTAEKSQVTTAAGALDPAAWDALCQAKGLPTGCDLCEAFGWYEDGACDGFCPRADPDCGLPADGGTGCGQANGATLLYGDEFSGSLGEWIPLVISGACTWSVSGGELHTDALCWDSFVYAPSTSDLFDYRIVTRAHAYASTNLNTAMEITYRLSVGATPAERTHYYCNWEPQTGDILIIRDLGGPAGDATGEIMVVKTVPVPGAYTWTDSVTIEATAQGADMTCRVCEIPGAEVTLTDSTLASGAVGLKVWAGGVGFDFIRVYAVP